MNMRAIIPLLALPFFSCTAAQAQPGGDDAKDAAQATRFKPFRNESDSIALGDLTVENRRDRIELYGALAITRDKAGLELARSLKRVVDATVDSLQASALPERIPLKPTDTVASPFAAD